MKNIVALISGKGTNLRAISDSCDTGISNGGIVAVFSDRPTIFTLEKTGVKAIGIDSKRFSSPASFEEYLMAQIDNYSPELVVLAGYMRVLGYSFVQHYLGRIINIHPSILPKYPGLNTHQRAIDAGDREHGASVHFVTEELDGGPIIMQAPVPIAESDSAVSLAKKVQEKENVIYPLVVKWFIEGRLKMKGKKAFLDGKPLNFPDHT